MKTKTPQNKINKHALNIFDSVESFQKFLREIYGKDEETIKARGFYPSIDNVAVDGILYTMEEYDNSGRYIAFYNKRTDTRMEIETINRYDRDGWSDSTVVIYENWGGCRLGINHLD